MQMIYYVEVSGANLTMPLQPWSFPSQNHHNFLCKEADIM